MCAYICKCVNIFTTLLSFLIAEYCMQIHTERDRERENTLFVKFLASSCPTSTSPAQEWKVNARSDSDAKLRQQTANNNNKATTTTTAAWHVYCVAFFFVTKLLLEFHIMYIYLSSKLLANWQTYLFLVSLPSVHDLKKNFCWKNRNQSWPSCESEYSVYRNELVSPAIPNWIQLKLYSYFEMKKCWKIQVERLYNILNNGTFCNVFKIIIHKYKW